MRHLLFQKWVDSYITSKKKFISLENSSNHSQSKDDANIIWKNDVKGDPKGKNFWANPSQRWPKGRIPYVLSPEYSEDDIKIIKTAMNEWQSKTCVRFTPKGKNDTNYVEITPNDGTPSYCYCHVGRQGGKQLMKMYGECMRPAAMIHEFGHLIGFNHEHQRPDRNEYIKIHFENIYPRKTFR